MKILFLTNNNITQPLIDWLVKAGEEVVCESNPINVALVRGNDISFVISYNYRHIIKKDVIEILPHSIINLHTSLLPYNKGADPNIWSFIEGTPNGVTIHEITEGLDEGSILLQKQIEFDPEKETLSTSYEHLHNEIQSLFKKNWSLLKTNMVTPFEQPQGGSVHKKRDALLLAPYLDYDITVSEFLARVRHLKLKD